MPVFRIPFVVAVAIGLAGSVGPVGAAPPSDFDDGTLQGWVANPEPAIALTNPGAGGNPGGYALLVDVRPGGPEGPRWHRRSSSAISVALQEPRGISS